MDQQPRNSSAATFASMLAQNIVVLLDEIDQLKAEVTRLRIEAQPPASTQPAPDTPAHARTNGGALA